MTTNDIITTLEYKDSIEGIDQAIAFLRSRRNELTAYYNTVANYLTNIDEFISFINTECARDTRYSINATTLRNAYIQSCRRKEPDLEIPNNFAVKFGKLITTVMKDYPEYGINRKYTKTGTEYLGLRLRPLNNQPTVTQSPVSEPEPQPEPVNIPESQPEAEPVKVSPVSIPAKTSTKITLPVNIPSVINIPPKVPPVKINIPVPVPAKVSPVNIPQPVKLNIRIPNFSANFPKKS